VINKINNFWGIKPEHQTREIFTGYESLYSQFDQFTKEVYAKDPEGTIEKVFNLYRSVNLVPIKYYTEAGLIDAISEFRHASYNGVDRQRIGLGNNAGQSINRFIFTNMMTAEPKGRGSNSLRDRFYNDTKLKRAIRICFEFREGLQLVYPTAMRRALELVTGENITNFKAQNARAIVDQLCTTFFGRVYDYSCGYGGRLLGTSVSNMNVSYIGVDPNTETYEYLQYLDRLIGNGRNEIYQKTSQEFEPEDIDLAFSSPPYFNLEKYSNEPTQCMVQFGTLDDWFDGYVVPTMQNIYRGLNSDGVFATNIADYKTVKEEFKVVDRWIETAEQLGFKHTGIIKMMLNTRPGVGNDKLAGREKWEGVYLFKK
jgi:SAM-dependent methyltransferase